MIENIGTNNENGEKKGTAKILISELKQACIENGNCKKQEENDLPADIAANVEFAKGRYYGIREKIMARNNNLDNTGTINYLHEINTLEYYLNFLKEIDPNKYPNQKKEINDLINDMEGLKIYIEVFIKK